MVTKAGTLVTLALLAVACATNAPTFAGPHLSPDHVISVSEVYLTEQGVDLQEFKLERISFEYVAREWWLFYDSTSPRPRPGEHFSLLVSDEATPEFKYIGGR